MATRTLELIVNQSGSAKAGIDDLNTSLAKTGKSAPIASGGITGLADSLGLAVSPAALATAGIAALGAATVASVNAAREGRAVQGQLAAVLTSTGNAAGTTVDALNKHAEALQSVTNYDDEAIGSAQALLLTFTKISGEVMPEATKTILDMSTALGQDLKSSTMQVGKALNDPIKGITALTRVGVSFTEEQKNMIKSLVAQGDIVGAQMIILKELNTEFGGSAEAAREADGGFIALGNSLGNLSEAFGSMILSGNESLGIMENLISTVNDMTQAVEEGGGGMGSLAMAISTLGAVSNPLAIPLSLLGIDIIPNLGTASETAAEGVTTLADAHGKAAQKAGEQATATSELSLSQMDALTELGQLDEAYNEKKQGLLDDRLTAESDAAESTAENYRGLQERLAEIDATRGEQTNEEIAAKKEKVIAGYNEENIEIKAKLDERQQAIDEQLAKEKAQHEEKAQEIKRLMALQVLEQSGQLEELTGIAGITAQQYMDAVAAGAISANKEVETQAATTEKTFEGSQKRAVDVVRENQALIARLHGETSTAITEGSRRTTDSVVTDFDRQADAARATYDARMSGQETVNYSGGAGRASVRFSGPGYATGGSFKVPPGYPNDSFPMRVQTGERVTVEPAGSWSATGLAGPGFARGTGHPTWNGSTWIAPDGTNLNVGKKYGQKGYIYEDGSIAGGGLLAGLSQAGGEFGGGGGAWSKPGGGSFSKMTDAQKWAVLAGAGKVSGGKASASSLSSSAASSISSRGESVPVSSPISSGGGIGSGPQGITIHIDYHPAVSLSDQNELIRVLKGAVREINRLDKVVTLG